MAQPLGENQPTVSEALGQVSPELAWAHESFEGLFMISRLACEAYGGLKPAAGVEPPEAADTEDKTEIVKGVPRTNITVVGPTEIEAVAVIIGEPTDSQTVYSGTDEGRIDFVVGFDITGDATQQEQATFFEDAYGEAWLDVQRRNTSQDFAYRMGHLIPDLLGRPVGDAVAQYRRQLGLHAVPELREVYGAKVASNIHEIFCLEEHLPPDWEVPDAI